MEVMATWLSRQHSVDYRRPRQMRCLFGRRAEKLVCSHGCYCSRENGWRWSSVRWSSIVSLIVVRTLV